MSMRFVLVLLILTGCFGTLFYNADNMNESVFRKTLTTKANLDMNCYAADMTFKVHSTDADGPSDVNVRCGGRDYRFVREPKTSTWHTCRAAGYHDAHEVFHRGHSESAHRTGDHDKDREACIRLTGRL